MSAMTLWIVWAVIGVIGGYMGAKLLLPHRGILPPVFVSVIGSLLGGWLYVTLFGMTDQNGYVSLITSMILCALFLWVYCAVCDRSAERKRENEEEEKDE